MRNKNLRPLAIVACFCSFIQLFWCAAASAHDSFPSNTTTSDPDPGSTSGTAGCFTAGVPLLVNTTSGIVLGGHIEPSVVAWRGIPYAEPPLGRLRFEPPQPLARPRAHILDARRYGPACFQFAYNTVLSAPIPREQQSEDCLTVNVFRSFDVGAQDPAQRSALNGTTASSGPGGGGLPVLVWVHGGGFAEGSSSVQFTPSEFVRNHPEILVATFNYRLNIFGFPHSPAIGNASANAGLRDLRLALEWLRDNVRAFGGNPARMVALGHSAGSSAVGTQLFAYPSDPIVRGAILMSGPVVYPSLPGNPAEFRRVAVNAGCADAQADARRELECMKRVDARRLASAVSNATLNEFVAPSGGFPRIDNVLVFPPSELLRRAQVGQIARIPIVIGHTEHEGDSISPWTPQGINYTLSDFLTIVGHHCPTLTHVNINTVIGVRMWRYLFRGIFPSYRIYPWLRAYHAQDAFLFWGYRPRGSDVPLRPVERAAMAYLQNAWAAFVVNPLAGLTEFGWPHYRPNTSTLVELFAQNQIGATFTNPSERDRVCANVRV